MLDTVLGLPVHVLVVHAVVVLGPVTGLAAIAYAVRPPWRAVLRLPLAVLSVATALSAAVAASSGEALEERLRRLGVGGATLDAIAVHSDRGELARNVAILLAVVALAAVLRLLRPAEPRTAVAVVTAVVLALTGAALVVTTTLAGHSGSSAVWSDIGAA